MSLSPVFQLSIVVATRRTPSCSLIANWLSSRPGTSPEAWYVAEAPSPSVNAWIRVGGASFGSAVCPPCWTAQFQSHDWVATYRLVVEA